MVNTLHKQVIHAILQPVMLRVPSCGLCEIHRGFSSRTLSYTHRARLCTSRPMQHIRAARNSRPVGPLEPGNDSKQARQATAATFSKAATSSLPCTACKAAPAGHTASLQTGPAVSGPGLSGMALSDSEASDEDEPDSAIQVADLSDGEANIDEAVTGYIQDGSAETVLVKSKAEAHEQVNYRHSINSC